ncbi:MAG: nicotinate phosphoribosyltransferase [Candidatus Omnitrophica bacterium]|nr:nicotinate phosphoribosyltransferase [Candidatus Omnitrophota bacterium]MCF7879006.1 nicotinate phosphoribosyltransferase [Candidatus Omnitrophota bacterium]MCF7888152.1 nicotinate phosphoribosyltransferase [Candidatus Omnitrophota bacterium]
MERKNKKISEGILFTDFYQLTMAQVYFKKGLHQKQVQFDYFFRKYPEYNSSQAGYCIFAGLQSLLEWMQNCFFGPEEIEILANHKGAKQKPIFSKDFLDWLSSQGNFKNITLEAIPEGRVVHPDVPVVTVRGPLIMAQILESSLLNHLNYQSLIATKASRIHEVGRDNLLLEFGLRRGQGKGANAGVRAALIGGADFSSNSGTSYELGFAPKGTHAHSMVQAFIALGKSELEAFRAYADIYPDSCILLVDTINTLESGVPNAIKVFQELKAKGHKPLGVRLDSGDLAYLAIQTAKMLNQADFNEAKIILSNKLDEMVIWQILTQIEKEASKEGVDPNQLINRLVYGVGTRLITSKGHPALDGVYKLVAISDKGSLRPAIKLSETPAKTLNPGRKGVWRIYDQRNKAIADVLTLEDEDLSKEKEITLHHLTEEKQRTVKRDDISEIKKLHQEIIKDGKVVYNFPTIDKIRETRKKDLELLDSGVKRLINPHRYHVSLSKKLWGKKKELIAAAERS